MDVAIGALSVAGVVVVIGGAVVGVAVRVVVVVAATAADGDDDVVVMVVVVLRVVVVACTVRSCVWCPVILGLARITSGLKQFRGGGCLLIGVLLPRS